jgi:hypothetical protein
VARPQRSPVSILKIVAENQRLKIVVVTVEEKTMVGSTFVASRAEPRSAWPRRQISSVKQATDRSMASTGTWNLGKASLPTRNPSGRVVLLVTSDSWRKSRAEGRLVNGFDRMWVGCPLRPAWPDQGRWAG